MNERFKKMNKFLEEEIENIIDFYDYQKEDYRGKEKHEIEDLEELFIQTLIGYINQKKKFKEGDEFLN